MVTFWTIVLVLVIIVAIPTLIYAFKKLGEGVEMQDKVFKEMYGASRSELLATPKTKKDASVVGRAVVGGVIAGPAGAVVGALSAVDKNSKNKK